MKRWASIILLAASTAQADSNIGFTDGNKLYERLNGEATDLLYAYGYISGVSDTGQGVTHCVDRNVTVGQLSDMVKQFLSANPGDRHYQADTIVIHVLKSSFPCRKSRT